MRPTSVGKSGIDEGGRIVQTCNLTYCTACDFRHVAKRQDALASLQRMANVRQIAIVIVHHANQPRRTNASTVTRESRYSRRPFTAITLDWPPSQECPTGVDDA